MSTIRKRIRRYRRYRRHFCIFVFKFKIVFFYSNSFRLNSILHWFAKR
jgi:hypothetical protein